MQDKVFKPGRFLLLGIVIICAVVLADQYTKFLVLETLLHKGGASFGFGQWLMTHRPLAYFTTQYADYKTLTLAPFLDFTMVWNKGISFGLFNQGGAGGSLALIGIAVLVSLVMLTWMGLTQQRWVAVFLSLIVGGAIGNVIDRIRFGAVADFIDLHVSGYHWPAFNLADSMIVVGGFLLVLDALLNKEKESLEG